MRTGHSFGARLSLHAGVLAICLAAAGAAAQRTSPKLASLDKSLADRGDIVTLTLLRTIEEARQKGLRAEDAFADVVIHKHDGLPVVDVLFEPGQSANAKIPVAGATLEYLSEYHDVANFTIADPEAILALAELPGVRMVKQSSPATTRVGLAESRAPIAHSVDRAQTAYRVFDVPGGRALDGRTQKIGVLSDSFSTTEGVRDPDTTPPIGSPGPLQNARNQKTGDLPAVVDILLDLRSPNEGIDEGAAMAELIHDIAPGASIAFHTAFISEASFADGIRRLWQEADSTVVVDDVGYFFAPIFQHGIIAQAARNATLAGVPYFSSAGNSGDLATQFTYVDINPTSQETASPPLGTDLHRWPNGTGFLPIQVNGGVALFMKWNQPFGSVPGSDGSQIDLDMYLTSEPALNEETIIASSTDIQGTSGDPFGDAVEALAVTGTGTAFLAIDHFQGNRSNIPQSASVPVVINLQFLQGFGDSIDFYVDPNEGLSLGNVIFGHPLADGVMSTAAVPWWESPRYAPELFGETDEIDPESFTSRGGTITRFFDDSGNLSVKNVTHPKIAAVDGNNTTFFGSGNVPSELNGFFGVPDNFPNFFGTSAAAPNAAAIAALMLDIDPTLTPAEIEQIMRETAIDVTGDRADPGVDPVTGPGLLDAEAAIQRVADAVGLDPVVTPTPTPTPEPTATPAPLTRQGFVFQDTPQGWTFGNSPAFTSPQGTSVFGALLIQTFDNTNTFGFFESPSFVTGPFERFGDVPILGAEPNTLYRTTFIVSSDVPLAESDTVPTIRLRTGTEGFEQSDVLAIESTTNAELSPTTRTLTYRLYSTLPPDEDRFNAFVDVLNFNPADAASAQFVISRVTVDAIQKGSLGGFRNESVTDFSSNQRGWAFDAPEGFAAPASNVLPTGLTAGPTINPNDVAVGFWTSPPTGTTIEAGRLYRARFRVLSTANPLNALALPTFRLRANETSLNLAGFVNVESVAGALLPAGSPVEYELYFEGRPEVAGNPLLFAFDYLFVPGLGNDPNLTISLQRLQLDSFLAPP